MQAPTVSFSGSVICGPPARRALVGGNHYAELLAKETGRYLRFLGRIGRCPRNPRLRGRSCARPNGIAPDADRAGVQGRKPPAALPQERPGLRAFMGKDTTRAW